MVRVCSGGSKSRATTTGSVSHLLHAYVKANRPICIIPSTWYVLELHHEPVVIIVVYEVCLVYVDIHEHILYRFACTR